MKKKLARLYHIKRSWTIVIAMLLFQIRHFACFPSEERQSQAQKSFRENSGMVTEFFNENSRKFKTIAATLNARDNISAGHTGENESEIVLSATVSTSFENIGSGATFTKHLQKPEPNTNSKDVYLSIPSRSMFKIGTVIFKIPFEENPSEQGDYVKFLPVTSTDSTVPDIETLSPLLGLDFPIHEDKTIKIEGTSRFRHPMPTNPELTRIKKPKNENIVIWRNNKEKKRSLGSTTITAQMNSGNRQLKNQTFLTTHSSTSGNTLTQNFDKPNDAEKQKTLPVDGNVFKNIKKMAADDEQQKSRDRTLSRSVRTLFPSSSHTDKDKDKIHFHDTYPAKTIKFIKSLVEDAPWESLFMRMVRMVVDHFVDKTLEKIFASHKEKRSLDTTVPHFRMILETILPEKINSKIQKQEFHLKAISKEIKEFIMRLVIPSLNLTNFSRHEILGDKNSGKMNLMLKNILNQILKKNIPVNHRNDLNMTKTLQFFIDEFLNAAENFKLDPYKTYVEPSSIFTKLLNYIIANKHISINFDEKKRKIESLNEEDFLEEITEKGRENESKLLTTDYSYKLPYDINNLIKATTSASEKNSFHLETENLQNLISSRISRTLFPFKAHIDGSKIHINDTHAAQTIKFIKSLVEDAPWESLFMQMVRMVVDHFVEKTIDKLFASHKEKRSLNPITSYIDTDLPRTELLKIMLSDFDDENNDSFELAGKEMKNVLYSLLQGTKQNFNDEPKTLKNKNFLAKSISELFRNGIDDMLTKQKKEKFPETLYTPIFQRLRDEEYSDQEDIETHREISLSRDDEENPKTLIEKSIASLNQWDYPYDEVEDSTSAFSESDSVFKHLATTSSRVFSETPDKNAQQLEEVQHPTLHEIINEFVSSPLLRKRRSTRSKTDKYFQKPITESESIVNLLKNGLLNKTEPTSIRTTSSNSKQTRSTQLLKKDMSSSNEDYLKFLKEILSQLSRKEFSKSLSVLLPEYSRNRDRRSYNKLWHDEDEKPPNQRKFVDCSLRSACNAGRLLSRLPSVHEITLQLRKPGEDEPHWDALLWGMQKKRCTKILCKRYRAPKGSKRYKQRVTIKEHRLPKTAVTTNIDITKLNSENR